MHLFLFIYTQIPRDTEMEINSINGRNIPNNPLGSNRAPHRSYVNAPFKDR